MSNDVERNKALIRAHYEATVNRFDPTTIDEQVADDFFDHAAGTRLPCGHVLSGDAPYGSSTCDEQALTR